MAKGMMDSIATQSLRGLILRKRGKIEQRHQKGWLINKIFHHFVSSWRAVTR